MSSHREAPEISKDPVADSTDVYAFVSPDRPDTVTLIANYIPLQEPSGGPNFYEFGDDVLYEIHVDNDGDGEPDISYQFRFETRLTTPTQLPVQHGTDRIAQRPELEQQAVLHRSPGSTDAGSHVLGRDLACPPCNVGVLSTPNYEAKLGKPGRSLPAPRCQGLRRPARRGVLRRPGLDLRPGQPAPAAAGQRLRQGGRAEERAGRERHGTG